MTSWPPPDVAIYRQERVRSPFERALQPTPPPLVVPSATIVQACLPLPGQPILWCRCGSSIPNERGVRTPRTNEERKYFDDWHAFHTGTGHRVEADDHRAMCKPHLWGCRNCGNMPPAKSGLHFYCSARCRNEYDRNHYWSTAREYVVQEASRLAGGTGRYFRCARCQQDVPTMYAVLTVFDEAWPPGRGTDVAPINDYLRIRARNIVVNTVPRAPEVNHIHPVNGLRRTWGCEHHLANLEALCHGCHLIVTAEQRAAGLIGRVAL